MLVKVPAVVTGVRRAKGEFEGTPYDYTELLVEEQFSAANADAKGSASVAYRLGKSDEFNKYSALVFPSQVELELETVAVGSKGQSRIECRSVRVISQKKSA